MRVLSKEEIQFIDTYLKNSDVRFADIRMEMVDHVASELENRMSEDGTDFYDTFKWYMAENKSSLLKQNRNYLNEAEKKLFKQLFRNIASWQGFSILVVSFLVVFFLKQLFNSDWLEVLPLILNLVAFGVYGNRIMKLKLRFSAFEHIGIYLFVLPHYIYMWFKPTIKSSLESGTTIWLVVSVAIPLLLLQLMVQAYEEHKQKYQSVS